jgi:cell division protein FtsB
MRVSLVAATLLPLRLILRSCRKSAITAEMFRMCVRKAPPPTHYFLAALAKLLFKVMALVSMMLRDLAQVDHLISELSALTGVDAQDAAEKLMQTCSANEAAFQYLQDRMCDAAISERARNQIHLIIAKIRTWTNLHYTYGWKEAGYA